MNAIEQGLVIDLNQNLNKVYKKLVCDCFLKGIKKGICSKTNSQQPKLGLYIHMRARANSTKYEKFFRIVTSVATHILSGSTR